MIVFIKGEIPSSYHSYESGCGFSYRPSFWDKFNLLGKYSYVTDLPPGCQNEFRETTESIRHVYSIEGIYGICRFLSITGKTAYRDMSEKTGTRDWLDRLTYLYLGRLNFHVTKKWDISTEYHVLTNEQIEDTKSGWLIELDRDIGQYIRIGTGYNFTDYDDDLRDSDNWDAKGWFLEYLENISPKEAADEHSIGKVINSLFSYNVVSRYLCPKDSSRTWSY